MARNIFIEKDDIQLLDKITIKDDEFNHLVNVLRYKVNDEFNVSNNSGFIYLCKLLEIRKKEALIQVLDKTQSKNEPKVKIDVFQALVKGDKYEFLAQKLTEIGATSLIPFDSEFCQVKPNTTRLDRLNKISIEACKQCGRAKSLNIGKILTFDEMLEQLPEYDCVFFAYEKATDLLPNNLLAYQSIALIIGSEGGFSENEYQKLSILKNVKCISLGKRILRAETAGIVLTSNVIFLSKLERN